jgi:hypothetical protein
VPEVRLTAAQLEAALRKRFREDIRLIEKAALDTAMWGEQRAVKLTDQAGLVDEGAYRRGWRFRRVRGGAELGNSVPYAPVIEHGRRPGPPYAPILAWVRRKLVANGQVAPDDAASVAFAIRASIHKKGSPPRKILARTYDDMVAMFRRTVRQRLARSTQR